MECSTLIINITPSQLPMELPLTLPQLPLPQQFKLTDIMVATINICTIGWVNQPWQLKLLLLDSEMQYKPMVTP